MKKEESLVSGWLKQLKNLIVTIIFAVILLAQMGLEIDIRITKEKTSIIQTIVDTTQKIQSGYKKVKKLL